MRASRVFVVASVALLLGALVGGGLALALQSNGGSGVPSRETGAAPIPYPTASGDALLRVSWRDAADAPVRLEPAPPNIVLFGDGLLVTFGLPCTATSNGPSGLWAIRDTSAVRLTPEGVRAVLARAQAAGMFDASASYGDVRATGGELFALSAGSARRTFAFADGASATPAGATATEVSARERFGSFACDLLDRSWLPAGSVEPGEASAFDRVAVYVKDGGSGSPAGTWPLDHPLATFGKASSVAGYRCEVVEGRQLAVLVRHVETHHPAVWRSGGNTYTVAFRPMLPGDPGC
jgi:hypothetical protein